MPSAGYIRRRQGGVLVVGRVEPEVQPWLRSAGHLVRAVADAPAALTALDAEPADLVITAAAADGTDAATVCRALRDDPLLDMAWILAITARARGRVADDVLLAGADDYLHRPFTRGELLARAGAGLRAAQQRSDDSLLRALMTNVPGAIYRSAWHDGHCLELISDEIERISGYPPAIFIASTRRTLMSIIHPDDRANVRALVAEASADGSPFVLEYRIVRADGEVRWVLDRGQLVPGPGGRLWMDGAIFDITDRRLAELKASRARIVEAADAARRRIERDLHDGAQQRLVALALEVQLARTRLSGDPAALDDFLERVRAELAEASGELRELARGIHPAVLTERGLAPAIAALAARAPVPVDIVELPEERFPTATEAAAYFTVSEALTNVAKYAEASQATVRLAREGDVIVVEVSDDGVGGADPSAGSGLSGLADRVGAFDGSLSVESPPGRGTTVRAVLPLAAAR